MTKIIAVLALSLGMGTAAIAQTDPPGSLPSGQGNAPTTTDPWSDQDIYGAFFSGAGSPELLTEEEIRTNWGNLTVEQQAQVRTSCDEMTSTASTQDSNPTTSTMSGAGVAGPNTAGGQAPGTQLEARAEVCDIIGDM